MRSDIKAKIDRVVTNLRTTRERFHYTQEYMAMKLNVSQNAYSKLELGYSKLTITRLVEICELLEIKVEDLLETDKTEMDYEFL